ncbi:hypothetical protein SDC9_203800 [bioreactor metagenome]|uniref:Uncharacterized protein n=1 Tax=bioreactor metagenome TaxID=1076179 RepID=A0A645J6L6_9ZZZZ
MCVNTREPLKRRRGRGVVGRKLIGHLRLEILLHLVEAGIPEAFGKADNRGIADVQVVGDLGGREEADARLVIGQICRDLLFHLCQFHVFQLVF